MFTYSPPAGIDDLAGRPTRDGFLNDWHDFIARAFNTEITSLRQIKPKLDPQFATEVSGVFPGNAVPVTWNAFPLFISRLHHNDSVGAWKDANRPGRVQFDTLTAQVRRQDEYCEWFEYRSGGSLQKIVFTAEGPEYWIRLAKHDLGQVVSLYQKWVSPEVQKADLQLSKDLTWLDKRVLPAGSYNPYNSWNTTKGVMHLTHPANTLGAEINLAARATVLRRDAAGNRITDVRHLACCSNFGDANRSSDPNIGSAVNTSCVSPGGQNIQDVTLADPVALYIDHLQDGALTGPEDEPLDDWFKIVRGVKGRGLMAVLAPPPGAAFGLDKVKVKGIDLGFGGQVAEVIQMVLYAKVRPHAGAAGAVPVYGCTKNCCAPVGTQPADYKNINFDSLNDTGTCDAGNETAYGDGAAVVAFAVLADAVAEVHPPDPGKRAVRVPPST
jgi:hypothetical protein